VQEKFTEKNSLLLEGAMTNLKKSRSKRRKYIESYHFDACDKQSTKKNIRTPTMGSTEKAKVQR
jgi:hypothetical protein